jgi:hypothetical protein
MALVPVVPGVVGAVVGAATLVGVCCTGVGGRVVGAVCIGAAAAVAGVGVVPFMGVGATLAGVICLGAVPAVPCWVSLHDRSVCGGEAGPSPDSVSHE